jgi:large subunit ribosomal protein L30
MSKATSKATSSAAGASQVASQVKVTLIRSFAGQLKSHQATVRGLGLRRIHATATVNVTPEVRGMLLSARHMLRVEQV